MRTTFFTAADQPYEPFVLPYVASVLLHNQDARVEICLEWPWRFKRQNAAAIRILRNRFRDRILLRPGRFRRVRSNSVRFLETPRILTEFTYIGDIDILVLEEVAEAHLRHMRKTGLPYSNIMRPEGGRISGLHFTRSDAYYPVRVSRGMDLAKMNDEVLLFQILEAKGLPMPNPDDRFRPAHGFHLSLNRRPQGEGMHWGLHESRLSAYCALQRNPIWRELVPLFDRRYRMLLMILDITLESIFPTRSVGENGSASYALRRLFFEIGRH